MTRLKLVDAIRFLLIVVVGAMVLDIITFIALSLTGCATMVSDPPGVTVVCRTDVDPCPSRSDVTEAMELFRDMIASTFDVDEPLEVNWYDRDVQFHGILPDRPVVGYTDDPHEVHVTSMPNLIHELMHVHLWRMFPESGGDPTHAEPPGPWTDATNEAIRDVIAAGGYSR